MNAMNMSCGMASVPTGVGDAVGVPRRQWYVAIVNHNTEKASSCRLTKLGYDCYVAIQDEYRVWRNGRRAKVSRVVIPSTVFIFCTEAERRHIVGLPFINRFMTDKAGTSKDTLNHPPAIVPNVQMDILRFMLGNSDTPVTVSGQYTKGDKVRVIRGRLRGIEGVVARASDGKSKLYVRIGMLGFANLEIDPINVEPAR